MKSLLETMANVQLERISSKTYRMLWNVSLSNLHGELASLWDLVNEILVTREEVEYDRKT